MNEHEVKIDPAQLRTLRESRAWSQEQLADIAGLNVRTVQRVEASGTASLETRMALAAALGIQPDALITKPEGQPVSAGMSQSVEITAAAPANRDWDRLKWIMLLVLLAGILIMLQATFGYNLGKGAAERDRRICQEHPERCQ